MVQIVSLYLLTLYFIIDKYKLFLLSFSITLYFIITKFLFENNSQTIILIEKISILTHIITTLIPFLINPGIPKREYYRKIFEKEYKGDFKKLKLCDKCNIIIPKKLNVGHCIYCNICIKDYDHHCPWIGKCIGKYNKIPFYLFLIGMLFYIISSIITFMTYLRYNFLLNK